MPNLNLTSIEVKRQSQSEIHWAHSSKDVGFLCQCSLSQLEFLNYFYILAILIYDISNKILKLTLFDHIYFWPLLASFRGCWKTFFWDLCHKDWLGVLKGSSFFFILANMKWTLNSYNLWVIAIFSKFYPQLDFGLNWGCI